MGRHLTSASAAALGGAAGFVLPGQLPIYGGGRFRVFTKSESWTVPADVFRVRARVLGGGAGATAGQASSFGAYCSATGGAPGSDINPGVGGVGVGGDFQASGGPGGAGYRAGGGASGSELGAGGAGGAGGSVSGGGGGAVGGKNGGAGVNTAARYGGGGASPFGHGSPGLDAPNGEAEGGLDVTGMGRGKHNTPMIAMPHPLFAFIGGGGPAANATGNPGGSGAGGSGAGTTGSVLKNRGPFGGICGGGGGASGDEVMGGQGGVISTPWDLNPTSSANDNNLRIGGGQGGNSTRAGGGGGGYARGEFDVAPGQVIPITVAQQSVFTSGVSGGLVIVEW